MKFIQAYDGDWIQPQQKNYQMACCDCGLVHTVNFRIVKGKVQLQPFRNKKATSNRRRNKKHLNQRLYL